MPISFTPIANGSSWAGHDWSIDDDDALADLVAHVAFGQYRHALHILTETDCGEAAPAPTALQGARQLLTVPVGADPWHRDGWLFQVVSWIAAHIQGHASLIAPPHMQHAEKGFDGIHVHIDAVTQAVRSVVICEDKATEHPRDTIRNSVWKEFASLEKGARDHLLVAKVSTLLETRPELNPDQAVQQILWKETRAFRVAITVDDLHGDRAGRERLFKGYRKIVGGDVSRRRAETLYLDDLRCWMERVAERALSVVEEMEAADV